MVMKVDVIDKAVQDLRLELKNKKVRVVLLDTKGPVYNQKGAEKLTKYDQLILIAGHYEGVDHRVHEKIADEVISIGEYVLTGGEIPVMVVVDSVIRLLPGVLGNPESLEGESYSVDGISLTSEQSPKALVSDERPSYKQHRQYTRPEVYKNWKVPKILLSGDHKKIEEWRKN